MLPPKAIKRMESVWIPEGVFGTRIEGHPVTLMHCTRTTSICIDMAISCVMGVRFDPLFSASSALEPDGARFSKDYLQAISPGSTCYRRSNWTFGSFARKWDLGLFSTRQ